MPTCLPMLNRGRNYLMTVWKTLFVLCNIVVYNVIPGTYAYDVTLRRDNGETAFPVFINFTLLPADAWVYVIRDVWSDSTPPAKFDPVRLDNDNNIIPDDASVAAIWQGVVMWEKSSHALRLDERVLKLIPSWPLTVIIEAKSPSMSLVSLIPVTIHMQTMEKKLLTSSPMVADYPHIIQSYQSRKLCMGSRPQFLLNVSGILPQFVRNDIRSLHNGLTTVDSIIEMREDTFWTTDKFCRSDQTQTRYHEFTIKYRAIGGEKLAAQAVDLLFYQTNETERAKTAKFRRHRRHRKTRAISLSFGSPSFTVSVTEEQPPPTYVTRMNLTVTKPVRFSMVALIDSRSQSLFSIDPETGVIQTETQLDRETKSEHFFRVTASQLDKLATATTTLTIRVEDINDYIPTFEKNDYFVELPENVAPGSVVVTVRANDYDAGENGDVVYSMITGDSTVFEIGGRSGVVTTRKPLDRETLQEIFLYVKAEDQGHVDQRKSSVAKISIKVLDENDWTPKFLNETCNIEIREDAVLPTIAQLEAVDHDAGSNAQITYSIVSGNPNGQFILDPVSGNLRVAAPGLDFETQQAHRLVIRAQDSGSPPRSNTTVCHIKVLDVNDGRPSFGSGPNGYSVALSEDVLPGHAVIQTRAYDSDEGLQGKIVYSLRNHSSSVDALPFTIDAESGWITTSAGLDREKKEKYTLIVEARDLGSPPQSATASVTVQILDVNDNGPRFEQRSYNVSLSENALQGTQICTVRAVDPDLNAHLTYQFISGNEDFRLNIIHQNGQGIILLAKTVNYRQEQKTELLVEVTDELGKSDRANVTVHVLAANLHRPTFLNAPFRVQIRENVPVGFSVIDLEALDEDVGENGRIIYSMSNDFTDTFHLNASTGRLSTRKLLDRETIPMFIIPVTATDKGVPSLSDVTEVLVELLDANDNTPAFYPHDRYSVAVKEDLKPQTSILQVSASDPDFGSNGFVYYTFDGGDNANGTFTVDYALGTVRTNTVLDREKTAEYELIVIAVDRGDPAQSSSATISVKVIDVNDNAPVFPEETLTYFVAENVTVGSSIGEISATDPDEDANAIVEYSIVGGPDAGSFALVTRPDGRPPLLSNLIELDHEGQKRDYKLIIRASSAHLQTDVSVNIIVTDVNDHAPVLRDFTIILNIFGSRSFPHRVIGKVPVTDRDATARLEYSITAGNKHNLLGVNPKTGEISLSSALNSDVGYSANFTIQVTDGLNTVSAVCTLLTIPVDQEMISNSVTLRVANMTARDILEPAVFHGITQSLAYICVCSPETVSVFGIADESESSVSLVNITFAAKTSLTSRTFMSVKVLKERLFAMRETLLNMTSLQLLPFGDEVCNREPCSNYEECVEAQKFGSAGSFIASGSMLFRSIHTVTTFDCRCPSGYTGMVDPSSCDTEINLCYSSPCGRNGTCHSTDGDYLCVCEDGFYGSKCEMDHRLIGCSDALCEGGATCSPSISMGLRCVGCPYEEQYRTDLCELTTRSFSRIENSYLAFTGIRARNRFDISLSLSTTHRHGLIFYNGKFLPGADFISLELVNGSAQFSFSLGQDTATVRLPVIITDGDWHRLEISYANRAARITVDDCDHALSLEHGRELDYHCAAVTTLHLDPHCSSAGALCNRFLDLSGPFYLGGLPADYSDSRIGSHHFEGCIRNVEIDKKLVDMNDYIHQHGTIPGCAAKSDFCTKLPCQNGGSCSNSWNGRVCSCLPGFGGVDCSAVLKGETFGLDGDGYLLVVLSTMLSDPLDLKFDFQPNEPTGIILAMVAKEYVGLMIRLQNHYLTVEDGEENITQGETFVTTNRWYSIRLLIQNGHVTVFHGGKKELELDFSNIGDDRGYSVLLGGKEAGQNVQRRVDGFSGCIREVQVSDRLVSPTFRSNVQNGCPDSNRNCAATACPTATTECKEVNGQFKCVCKHGFIGKQCKEVCSFEPCINGVCLPSKEALHGYQCHCFENFTGLYCDKMVPRSCAADWWGYPLCGPCNCDVSKGFGPRCDQRDGTCRCREDFYRLPGDAICHECGCYALGSLDTQCDERGQCQCREGVGGKRCDVCLDVQQELMEDVGCQKVYGTCPRALAEGVWWDRTPFGMSTVQPCPGNAVGSAVRSCDESTHLWSSPDLKNCSSLSFVSIDRLMLEYQEGILELTPHVSARLINSLRSALNASMVEGFLHLKDLSVAVNLTKMILHHEIQQSGMNLTHRRDKSFLLDLVESISQTLDARNERQWISLEQLERTSASMLTQLFLEYLKTVTTHLGSTQIRPFEVFTKNLRTGVSWLGRALNRRSSHLNTSGNSFEFPASIPRAYNRVSVRLNEDSLQRSSPQLLYYAEFTELPRLLSANRKTRQPKSELGSPLSSAFFFGKIPAESSFHDAVYQFVLPLQSYLFSAQCVSWDFQSSKWTNDKCSLLGWNYGTNGTYVECSCLSELLVAVLSGSTRNSIFRSVFPIFLFSTVVLTLALLLNFVTFVLLMAMRSNSPTICIAENLVLTAFATNLTFLLAANFEWDVMVCTILAAVLHYWVLSKFSWNLAQAINLLKYSVHSCLDRSSKSYMKLCMLLGYGLPILPVAASIALQPDGYGADDVCWMHFGFQMLVSLILPVTATVMFTLLVVITAHCKAPETRKPPVAAGVFELRHRILVCTTLSMFFVAGLSVAVVALNFGMTSLGYVFPVVCLGEAVFMMMYLCIKIPEAQLLKEMSFVWFVRKNFDKLSTKEKSRMRDLVCDTYQNPGLAISNSTTYHKAAQPDKDISGSIGRCSANSAFSHLSKAHPEDLIDNLNAYTSFQKNGDGTNEDTISVHSSSSSAKRYCSSARETSLRSPRVAHRSNSSLSTFGPPVPSWNSLPHSARTAKKNNIPSSHVRTADSPKLGSTFATFRPSSNAAQKTACLIPDAMRGEIFENPSEAGSGITKNGYARNGSSKNFVTLDHVETGTAV